MSHPFANIRKNKVERSRVSRIIKDYDGGDGIRKTPRQMTPEGDYARPRRAAGGAVKKPNVTVNVITQAPPPPQPMMPPPGPPMDAAPPPPPSPPPGGPPMGGIAGGSPPGMPGPGMPMRARGGKVTCGSAGTPVQHDAAKAVDLKNMNRPKAVTFKSGGRVRSFTAYANGGAVPLPKPRPEGAEPQPSDLYAPDQVKKLQRATGGCVGGAGSGVGRLKKTRMTKHGSQV